MTTNHTNTQPPLRTLVAMERFKIRKRPMTKIIFTIITLGFALLMPIGYLVDGGSTDASNAFLLPSVIPNSLQVIGDIGGVLLVILAAAVVGSEYGWGTVRVMVGSGVMRSKLWIAKVIALLEYTVLFVLAGFASATTTSLALMLTGGHDIPIGSVDATGISDVMMMLVRTIFGLLVLAALAFTVATLSRSMAAGIGIGIGLIVLESVLTTLLNLRSYGATGETIHEAFIMTNIDALQAANYFSHQIVRHDLPSTFQAAVVLALYSVVLLGIAFVAFQRRDIPSGA